MWARSRNLPNMTVLKRWIRLLLRGLPNLEVLVLEGGGHVSGPWEREAARNGLQVIRVCAEQWRGELLLQRQQETGRLAKMKATELARQILASSDTPTPASLTHDAAEALCIGLYAIGLLEW